MAAHNFTQSYPSNGVADGYQTPLKAGAREPLIRAGGPDSMLDNPGTDGADDRPPAPVPMHPYGWEADGDPLFALDPRRKG